MVTEKICAIIAEKLEMPADQLSAETTFAEMQVDSLYLVEIMLSIEEAFGVTIEEVEGMETIADLAAFVESHQN